MADEPTPDAADATAPPESSAATDATDASQQTPAGTPARAWRRIALAGRPRLTKANALATILALLLGFAVAVQIRSTSLQGLETLREDELARILDTLDSDGERLADEARRLETSRDLLRNSTTNGAEALRAAQQRLDSLGILNGSLAANGPGVQITIDDPAGKVTAVAIIDAVQELRDAGAEAIQIGEVRVVASTWFADGTGGVLAGTTQLAPPYIIRAIGDPHTLSTALGIPRGVEAQMRGLGAEIAVVESNNETIDALHTISQPQYARPVPTPSPS